MMSVLNEPTQRGLDIARRFLLGVLQEYASRNSASSTGEFGKDHSGIAPIRSLLYVSVLIGRSSLPSRCDRCGTFAMTNLKLGVCLGVRGPTILFMLCESPLRPADKPSHVVKSELDQQVVRLVVAYLFVDLAHILRGLLAPRREVRAAAADELGRHVQGIATVIPGGDRRLRKTLPE